MNINKKNILVVAGTRPEIIKLAPVIQELKRKKEFFNTIVLDSGQHKDIAGQFWSVFNIKPDKLFLPLEGKFIPVTLNGYIASFLDFLVDTINILKTDIVVVQGDTSTAFTAALAAFNLEIPVVHVEAGLRTHQLDSPFPEEGYRAMIDEISSLLLCPTNKDRNNVIDKNSITTGNTVIDAVKWIQRKNKKTDTFYSFNRSNILVTLHRRETQGAEMDQIFFELNKAIEEFPDITWNIIKHHNPNVVHSFEKYIKKHNNLNIFGSQPYDEFIDLMSRCQLIISDSGGIQEEATALEKTVLLLRDYTERMDAVEAGWVKMIKTQNIKTTFEHIKKEIISTFALGRFATLDCKKNVYGNGNAAKISVQAMIEQFCK